MCEPILMKFSGLVALGARKNLDHFQDVPYNPLNTGNFFRGIRAVSNIAENG